MARLVSFVVLAGIIILFAVIFFQVMAQFLLPMFLAVILVVVFRPVHQWFIVKCGGRVRTAAGLTTLAILVMVLAPLLATLTLAIRDATEIVRQTPDASDLLDKVAKLRKNFGLGLGLPVGDLGQLRYIQERLNTLQDESAQASTMAELRIALEQAMKDPVEEALPINDAPTRPPAATLYGQLDELDKALQPQPHRNPDSGAIDEEKRQAALAALSQLRTTLAELTALATAETGVAADAEQTEVDAFKKKVGVLTTEFNQLREVAVGGPLQEYLRVWANPTREQISSARAGIIETVQSYAVATGSLVGGFVVNFVVGLAVLVISLYYFLADGPSMINTVMRLLPLDDRYERQLLEEFDRISRAVVLATILSALVQGILAAIAFWFLGIEAVFFLMVVTMLLALVPFVGAAAVWGSVSVWLLVYKEQFWPAVFLVIYGTCVISMADNVIKPIVLHGQSKLHPLLALLSVLGGVRALGPIGIFIGPMAVAFLQALLNILNTELIAFGQQRSPTLHAPE